MITERRHDIDWLRVIAIGLLLIYHIAIIFQPWAMFIGFIRSDELLVELWKPMTMLNVWRIPLLFYVSGMGVFFAIQKRTIKQLLFERAKRIGLPYVFGIFAIVPLHFLIFQKYYGQQLSYFAHPAHLWFLGNIAIYISVFFPFFYAMMKNYEGNFRKRLSAFMSNPLGPLSISVFFVAEVLIVNPESFSLYAQTMHGYFNGFLAFFFGFLFVYVGKELWITLLKWRGFYTGIALIMYIIRLTAFEGNAPNYFVAIESNLWIFGALGFGYKYLNKPSKILTYLSSAAYPVYIIHMFALYLASLLILPLEISGILKFIGIVVLTFVLCFLIFEFIIKRNEFLKPFFGMKINWKFNRLNSSKIKEEVSQLE